MRIDIISVIPELMHSLLNESIMKRSQEKGILDLNFHNLRDYSSNKQKSVDDYQYGGGAGMVLSCQPLSTCINELISKRVYDEIIYMTPDGEVLNQQKCNQFSLLKNMIIICGHYKGIDERIRKKYVTREVSIGDFVLSGGEVAATVFVDAVVRLIPGVLNDETSALSDSFQDDLLAPPVYTRPQEFEGMNVPSVLLSGNFNKIEEWRMKKSIERTKQRRPDLLKQSLK